MRRALPILLLTLTLVAAGARESELWYGQPAARWEEALPLGNGRLGAMVFGSHPERLQLNEESLWAGEPVEVWPEDFKEHLAEVQRLVLAGKTAEAQARGLATLAASPTSFRSYQPLADLWIDTGGTTADYRRALDITTGMATVEYTANGAKMRREALISAVDDVLAVRLSADRPGSVSATIYLSREKDMVVVASGTDRLRLDGQIIDDDSPGAYDDNPGGSGPGGAHMKFAGRLLVRAAGGAVVASGSRIVVSGADEAVLLFTAATDYNLAKLNYDRGIDPASVADSILAKVRGKPWSDIVADHVREHRAWMDRVSLDLGPSLDAPTDERLKNVEDDPALVALYFQYGRYLLISSSRRPGRLPANLQGLWNDKMWAPWEADYHLNINLQMNYWPADVCNLPETLDPLVGWFAGLSQRGRESARRLYGADGWVAYLATNPFGRATPSASSLPSQFENSVLDPLAGAWMSMTLWRHYEFTRDEAFLRDMAYPILSGAAEFILDLLTEDADGRLVIAPSTSPENTYIDPETGRPMRITHGSTYHMSIVRVVFEAVIEGSEVLECDEALRARLRESLLRLPPIQVGADGTIQEWIRDYRENEPQHRHVSHLIGLYPFALITAKDAALFEAARATLARRGTGGDIGWSNAWKTSFYARLGDAETAHDYLVRLISRNAMPNLWNGCFPGRLFQIDGNLAGSAGIAEMLVQSHGGEINLLPALPKAWPGGRVRGLRCRGGFVVDIEWRDGRLVAADVTSGAGGRCRVRSAAPLTATSGGQRVEAARPEPRVCEFDTDAGRSYRLVVPRDAR